MVLASATSPHVGGGRFDENGMLAAPQQRSLKTNQVALDDSIQRQKDFPSAKYP